MRTVFFLKDSKEQPIEKLFKPLNHFLHAETSSGILLLIATAVALIWANSPWGAGYHHFWETSIRLGIGDWAIDYTLHHWINDALMAVFFFVVGLEIKREILVGELSKPKQAALPIAAAIGGMVAPAAFYFLLNPVEPALRGWGVPMATDIAFSLGILALVGKGVPITAKVFLTAFAIVDDIGASLVIAVFYTDEIWVGALIFGAVMLAGMCVLNWAGVRSTLPYALFGAFLWLGFLESGVHPTIAGILGAMAIPASFRIDAKSFLDRAKLFLAQFESKGLAGHNVMTNDEQRGALHALEHACELAQTPLQRLEHGLHPWVAFFIMPVFALANTGVALNARIGEVLTNPVSVGIILGLLLGKQIGVTVCAWIAVKLGIASLPGDLSWGKIYGLAWLGGIGFTMSLFIASLAFAGDAALLYTAKMAILLASLISGLGGFLILRRLVGSGDSSGS